MQLGQSYKQFCDFKQQVKSGKKAVIVGPDYIVMSMNAYNSLREKYPGELTEMSCFDEPIPAEYMRIKNKFKKVNICLKP